MKIPGTDEAFNDFLDSLKGTSFTKPKLTPELERAAIWAGIARDCEEWRKKYVKIA